MGSFLIHGVRVPTLVGSLARDVSTICVSGWVNDKTNDASLTHPLTQVVLTSSKKDEIHKC